MNTPEPQESIAIIGMAGRFPQAKNLEEFWRNLREGRECVSFFKDEPVQWLPIEHPPRRDDPRYVRARGVMEKPEWFDAAFFGMNPKEAEIMDPQHRVFLECAWEALEDAGCNPDTYEGLIGVFAGASMNTYLLTNLMTNRDLIADFGMFSSLIMNDGDFVPTRVSYKFNLRGPSINVQTACSTSLVAVAMAAQNLLGYRCDVALAGGVSITFPANRGQFHLEGGIMSRDGHCRTFDAQASGTVLGDGAGVVVLKRLSDALADGDRICAVIKGTAINNDGSVKIGYTAPSSDGQAEVIAMAHSEAGFAPETVSYVEAHGTGTPLGDPIEIAGLTKAFGLDGKRGQFCAVGSVKSNIGHLDIGAGVAGLIKTVLALQHGEIPPSLHFETPNPKIDLANSPFFVNNALRPWQRNGTPRRAGVSSFGIGGTNAHVAIEEAPALEPTGKSRPRQLLLLSAKTATALDAMTRNLASHLEKSPDADAKLADAAFTLQTGRKVFARRRAVVIDSAADAVQTLRAKDAKRVITGGSEEAPGTIAFMFPGQGAQAVNMARELYDTEPEFRANVDRCCEILRPKLGLDLRDVMFPKANAEEAAKLLIETRITQPAMFVIEHALAQLWMSWGVKPAAMIGHSLGEYVVATIAGVFTLEDALTLVAERARLMQAQPAGAMLAIRQAEQQVAALLDNNLALAAVNAPGLCVVSGPFDAVEAVEKRLTASAIPSKRLATSHAFHSPMMEPVLRPLAELVRKLKLNPPQIPWISNVTGTWITPEQAMSPDYWTTHLRQTVRFADGVAELIKAGHRVLLEVGPGQTLAGLAKQQPAASGGAATAIATLGRAGSGSASLPSEREAIPLQKSDDLAAMLHALGELWIAGITPDWRGGFYRNEKRRVVALPTYPFERKRYWIEPGMKFELGAASRATPVNAEVRAATMTMTDDKTVVDHAVTEAETTLTTLRGLFQELSGIDLTTASAEDTFYQLGFDSLFLTQASLAVAKRFGVEVTFRQLREDYVTLGKLAALLDTKLVRNTAPLASGGAGAISQEANGEKRLPLSDPQREMWYASQMGTSVSSAYNEESTLRLTGPLDAAALRHGLQQLAARHEALRTIFSPNGDVQIIAPTLEVDLPVHDLTSVEASEREARAIAWADDEVGRPFDLAKGPLFRAVLLRLEAEHHFLVLIVHHIICDGWSLGTLVRELGELYAAETLQRPAVLPPPQRFSDYVEREASTRSTPAYAAAKDYWLNQFADSVPVLELPTDRSRPSMRTYTGKFLLHTIQPDVTLALKRLCAERECTLFTTLLAAFNVLLHRLSGQDDLVVGVPSAAQVMGGLGNLVGHFANLLPVRSRVGESQKFSDYLLQLRGQMTSAIEHGQYPFTTLVQQLKLARDASRMPLANVVFNSSRLRGSLDFGLLKVEATVSPKRFVNFDLNFNFAANADTISLGCYYSTELFDEGTIARWIGHFETLLREIAATPDRSVAELPLLNAAERGTLLTAWNATAAEYPRERCVHTVAFEHAQKAPGAVALVHGEAQLTYGEVAKRATELASRLQALGAGPDVPIGICLDRSFEMIVAVLAVLRAGSAYLPLDPSYPADRLAFMLDDSRAPVLLTQSSLRHRFPNYPGTVICVDDRGTAAMPGRNGSQVAAGGSAPTPENLAYIIYTSGSTGKPKGVAMPHRPLMNLIAWQLRNSQVGSSGRTLQFSSLSFDVSFQEIFSTFAAGGTLVLVDDSTRRDARELWRLIKQQRVERIFLPFVALQQLSEAFLPRDAEYVALREVITAGEPLLITPKVAAMFTALHGCTLHNHYGPSETHVVTAYTLPVNSGPWEPRPPIGRPIANSEIYLLDNHAQPVPIGVPGELFIGGDCLARGYLNREDITREKFVAHPFRAGARLYRTGDLARYRNDGNIDFLGRSDHQVKLNGYRIELGEIEAVLSQHPAIGECVVMVRADKSQNRRLVAYYIPLAPDSNIPSTELREHLLRRLPEYMLPGAFVALAKIPLTPSGKVDRRALPAPELDGATGMGRAPRTKTEKALAEIWCSVLGINQVGVNANFFELGGHSLLASQVISRVHDVLKAELTLSRFFAAPTIASLASVIEQASKSANAPSIPRRSADGDIPLSFAQERLWLLDQLEPRQAAYNLWQAVRLEGPLDVTILEQSLNEIVRRHESLRTNFIAAGGRPVQVIAPNPTLPLPVVDVSAAPNGAQAEEIAQRLQAESRRPFDLERDLLVRALLVRSGPNDHTLMLTMHHIVSDGWSVGILFQELATIYQSLCEGEAVPLVELPLQYADFACWERNNLQGPELEKLLGFWKAQLGGTLPVLDLPYDRPRASVEGSRGASQSLDLPPALAEALKELSQQTGSTLFMTLLAAFQTLLHRWTGQDEIVIGSVAAGRRKTELENLIGFFVNTLVFRGDLTGNPTGRELLARVRETTLGVLAHQDLPFDRLVTELRPDRALSRNPLFQVLFVLQNAPMQLLELPQLNVQPVEVDTGTAKFDLTLGMMEMPQGLRATIEYNADLFEAGTIARMLGSFQTLLQSLAANPDERISRLEMLTPAERQRVLVEWNDTRLDYPREQCLHHLFEEQVRKTPDALALVGEGDRLTYRELDRRANQLAVQLRAEGIGPDSLVGIFLERRPQLIVGLLGVLKAGGAYVPLDPAYPADRLAYIVSHARMTTVVTERALVRQAPAGSSRVVLIDQENAGGSRFGAMPDTSGQSDQSLAYVIYTSGSTGQPKGVAIEHRSVMALIAWARTVYQPEELAGVVASTSACFDVSVFEMFVPLCTGGTVFLAENVLQLPPINASDRLTLMSGVPSAVAELVRRDKIPTSVRTVNLAGEPCPQSLVDALYAKPHVTRVMDLYGPTETTVYSTFAQRQAGGRPTIGRPLANEQTYVLDRLMQPVPIGAPGELYIGGAGLARGYLHQRDLTEQRFVADPFHPGQRLYRTGDRVRYREDGNIEFLGRLDHQVKLRGFRIELGEVEAALRTHGSVRECVVIVRTDQPNDPRLVAYVVASGETIDLRALRGHVQQRLPDYMVPSAIVPLEKIPLAPNGKIDRRALPAPDVDGAPDRVEFVAPRNATEELLADIWRDVLGLKQVSIHDNFFDLGGHSLLATQVMARISDFLGVELTVRQLFAAPTVAGMAPAIEAALIEDIKANADEDAPSEAAVASRGAGEKTPQADRPGPLLVTTKD